MKTFKIVVFWSLLLSSLCFSVHAAMIGETAYIVTSMNYPHVAVDEAGFDGYMKAIASNDVQYGVTELYQKGKLFQVENNVKVTILDKKFLGRVKVRILEGKKKGSSGWVAAEWIKNQPSPPKSTTGFKFTCSKVTIADTFPKSIPKGYDKEQKTKNRVVTVSTGAIVIMDTNKIGSLSACEIKMYPPIYFQEYYLEDNFRGIPKKRWVSRTVRDAFDLMISDEENYAIIQK